MCVLMVLVGAVGVRAIGGGDTTAMLQALVPQLSSLHAARDLINPLETPMTNFGAGGPAYLFGASQAPFSQSSFSGMLTDNGRAGALDNNGRFLPRSNNPIDYQTFAEDATRMAAQYNQNMSQYGYKTYGNELPLNITQEQFYIGCDAQATPLQEAVALFGIANTFLPTVTLSNRRGTTSQFQGAQATRPSPYVHGTTIGLNPIPTLHANPIRPATHGHDPVAPGMAAVAELQQMAASGGLAGLNIM